jgi:mediator of RNA polymerase II transcription subunit 31
METEAATSLSSSVSLDLPKNRFELELEFVQSLASPAYLHFLASSTNSEGQSLLLDSHFKAFLSYLQKTWSQPDYSTYITYPHSLYFLDLLIHNDAVCRELAQVSFRNFCHQQQYYAWKNRFSTLYGVGQKNDEESTAITNYDNSNNIDMELGEPSGHTKEGRTQQSS